MNKVLTYVTLGTVVSLAVLGTYTYVTVSLWVERSLGGVTGWPYLSKR